MRANKIVFIVIIGFWVFSNGYSAVIPEERKIYWDPGISIDLSTPDGIPVYPEGVNVIDFGATGDGVTDDTVSVQAAVNACPEGHAVIFPEGVYKTTNCIFVSKSIVLRGETDVNGRPVSVIKNFDSGSSRGVIQFSKGGRLNSPVSVLSGYMKGSNLITVSDSSGINAGDYVLIDQLNDNDFATVFSEEGRIASWMSRDSGVRAIGQILKVESVEGNTLTLYDSLNINYNYNYLKTLDASVTDPSEFIMDLTPQLLKIDNVLENAGIEDLRINALFSNAYCNIYTSTTSSCWVKNIESEQAAHAHIYTHRAYRCEIRDSYFHHARNQYGSNYGYGIEFELQGTGNLVENNIFYRLSAPMMSASGLNGSVWGYNYIYNTLRSVNEGDQQEHLSSDGSFHGGHPYMNLIEGNMYYKASFDYYWGSASHMTLFRNHIRGHKLSTDFSVNSRYANLAIDLQEKATFINIVGNVLGTENLISHFSQDGGSYDLYHEAIDIDCDYHDWFIYKVGYNSYGDGAAANNDQNVSESLIRHGNFDYVSNSTIWDPAISDHNLPASFYYVSKPYFFVEAENRFGVSLAWPPLGGDLENKINDIPAKIRFERFVESDNESPSEPAGFEAETVTSKTATLKWWYPEDNTGIDGVKIFKNGQLLHTSVCGGTHDFFRYRDETLVPETGYIYTIVAYDFKGNESGPVSVSVTTLPQQQYALTVINGSGSGLYDEGQTVSVVANDRISEGYTFNQWIGNTLDLSSAWVSSTSAKVWNNMEVIALYRKTAGDDTEAPHVPPNFRSENVTESSITLKWDVPYDDAGVSYYQIYYENGSVLDDWTRERSFVVQNLSANTTYSFKVLAVDLAGNKSDYSLLTVTTSESGQEEDGEAPSIPNNLTATSVSDSRIDLSWDASVDNVAVAGYKIFRNGTEIASASQTNYSDSSLMPETQYVYTISAFDAVGNNSGISDPVSVKTLLSQSENLTACYLFEEGSGLIVNDSGVNGLNGNVSGNVIFDSESIQGSYSMDFGGEASDFISVEHNDELNISDAITLSCWFKINQYGRDNGLILKNGAYQLEAVRGWTNDNPNFSLYIDGAIRNLVSSIPIGVDAWHHIAGTYDADTRKMSIYVDGKFAGYSVLSGLNDYTIELTDNNLLIGKHFWGNGFDGKMDEIRIYDKALAYFDIKSLYEKGLKKIDAEGPSIPENLNAISNAATSAVLFWQASTDNSGSVEGYEIYRNGILTGTSSLGSFEDENLIEGENYSYYVKAFDKAGNRSESSFSVSVIPSASSSYVSFHPKLFFSNRDITQLRNKAETDGAYLWEDIILFAEGVLKGSVPAYPEGESYGLIKNYIVPQLTSIAFAYVMTGDKRFADKAKEYLLSLIQWEVWGWTGDISGKYCRDHGIAQMIFANILAYDWIYDQLSDQERMEIRNNLILRTNRLCEAAVNPWREDWGNWWAKSWEQNHSHVIYSSIGLCAMVLEGETESTVDWDNLAVQRMQRISDVFKGIKDGTWHEGIQYQNYAMQYDLYFYSNLKRIKNQNFLPHEYLQNYCLWRLYNFIPDNKNAVISASSYHYAGQNEHGGNNVLRFIAKEYEDGNAQWLTDELLRVCGRNIEDYAHYVIDFIYFDPDINKTLPDIQNSGNARTFSDMESVIWRAGWGDDDLVFGFKTGAFGGRYLHDKFLMSEYPYENRLPTDGINYQHDHADSNTFYLFKGATDISSEYAAASTQGVAEAINTSLHNTIMIDNQNQFYDDWLKLFPGTDARLERVFDTKNFHYLVSDATNRYRISDGPGKIPGGTIVNSLKRYVLFADNSYFIIVDNVKADSPHRYDWISHFGDDSTVTEEDNWIKAHINMNDVLGINILSPSDFSIDAGNDGKPYVRIYPNSDVSNVNFVNVLYPTLSEAWGIKPDICLIGNSDSAVGVRVDLNGQQSHLIRYSGEETQIAGEYIFDSDTASIIKDDSSSLVKVFVGNGKSLSEAGVVLFEALEKITLEANINDGFLSVYGENINNFKIYAPSVSPANVTINDVSVTAYKSGEYIIIGNCGQFQENLIAKFSFEGSVSNEIQNGLAISAMGEPSYTLEKMEGNFSVILDGDNDAIKVSDNDVLDLNSSLTLSCWIKANETGVDNYIIYKSGAYFLDASRSFQNTPHLYLHFNGTTVSLNGTTIMESDIWYHLAATYDSSTNIIRLYVNGVKENERIVSGSLLIDNTENDLFIGRASWGGNFAGNIDDLRIYNIALPETEIMNIYDTSSQNHLPVMTPLDSVNVYEGEKISFSIHASDPDSDPVSISVSNKPLSAVFTDNGDGTAIFQWQTDFASSGTYNVFFTANDGTDASVPVYSNITINNINTGLGLTDNEWFSLKK